LTSGSLGNISWAQKLPHSCTVTQGMCHSSTHPPNVQVCHCTWSVLPGLPHVSTASDKRWGEKAWVRGYTQAQIEPTPTGFTVMTSSSTVGTCQDKVINQHNEKAQLGSAQ